MSRLWLSGRVCWMETIWDVYRRVSKIWSGFKCEDCVGGCSRGGVQRCVGVCVREGVAALLDR